MQYSRIVFVSLVSAVFLFFGCSSNNEDNDINIKTQGSADSSSSLAVVSPELNSSSSAGTTFDNKNNSSSSASEDIGEPSQLSSSTETDIDGSSSSDESSSPSNVSSSSEGSSSVSGSSSSRSSSSVSGSSSSRSSSSVSGSSSSRNSSSSSSFVAIANPKSFTETVGSESFDMVYIPGGTFTIGCEKSSGCPSDTKSVSGVTVSNYFIGKTEVTTKLWHAVMGTTCSGYMCSGSSSYTSMTWYDAMEFACKLSEKTGKNYRMTTEAEWEYAAKNHLSSLEKVGSGEEWAYNSWNSSHTGGTDPIGPSGPIHTQKTRRDAQGTADNITGRLIRSIEGVGPALRLAISADVAFPPNMVPACDLHAPKMEGEPTNSYRDKRWVTGSNARWTGGAIAIGSMDLRVWEDCTAKLGRVNGQWFTSNNIAFVFVPSSGSTTITKYAYIFLDESQGSVISDKGYTNYQDMGYIGRIIKEEASSVEKPTISDLKSGEALAKAEIDKGGKYKMWDMTNIPEAAKEQDPRLLDGPNQGWFQDNRSAGSVHHYRKDVDLDEFRFTVNQGTSRTVLANGKWFTVNNTFLRVTHSNGYTADYLYAVDSDGTFYHNSFMGYERGDFRMFKKTANAPENATLWSTTCRDICSGEIPKGLSASLYNSMDNGKSTFVPAPCPSGGCR